MDSEKILIIGYRPQIARRLHQHGIEFVIWNNRPLKKKNIPGCTAIIDDEAFATRVPRIKEQIGRLFAANTRFNYVIAGTEASVVTASVARRLLGARKSKDSRIMRCHNKRLMKEYFRDKGIPLIPFRYSGDKIDGKPLSANDVARELGFPLVAKPLDSSGGRGLQIIRRIDEIEPFLAQRVIFEKYVDAPEVSVESFISERDVTFISTTQYVEKRLVNLVPSGHPATLNKQLINLNQRVLAALDIEWGLTHAEYYLADDQLYFGEIAIRPPGGYIMELMSLAHDFNAWDAFVDNELNRQSVFGPQRGWAAAVLFHPGSGLIEAIQGQELIEADPLCRKMHFYARRGDKLGHREGAGEVAAYALFSGKNKTDTLSAVSHAQQCLVFNLSESSTPG